MAISSEPDSMKPIIVVLLFFLISCTYTNTRMDYKSIAAKIVELKDADLELRNSLVQSGQLGQGYNKEMENLHNRNAEILNGIIDTIGYPTTDKVG